MAVPSPRTVFVGCLAVGLLVSTLMVLGVWDSQEVRSLRAQHLRRLGTNESDRSNDSNANVTNSSANVTNLANETNGTNGTRSEVNVEGACLCVLDVDRTLTAKQGSGCGVSILGVQDPAYGGGALQLSALGSSGVGGTFCAGCFIGVASTGSAGGGPMRAVLRRSLGRVPDSWGGPPLMLGVPEGSKQNAVRAIVSYYEASAGVTIPPSSVFMFDDKASNVAPFAGTGFNAKQVSCGSRDGDLGLCGASPGEVSAVRGIHLCR